MSQVVSLCPARVHHMPTISPSHQHFDSVDLYPSSPSPLLLLSPPTPFSSRLSTPPPLSLSLPSDTRTRPRGLSSTPPRSAPPTRTRMFSSHRPSTRSEYLLRETLLKDEMQREKERGRDREREQADELGYPHNQPHHLKEAEYADDHPDTHPRRASLHRSYTESTLPLTLPRATSSSPTRRYHPNQQHRHHSKNLSLPHPHPHSESPYDQILRARLDRVLSSCQSQASVRKPKRASLPATPRGGTGLTEGEPEGGWLGWFWREDADSEAASEGQELGRGRGCERDSGKGPRRHERFTSSSESSGLVTPEDYSTFAHGVGESKASLKFKSRARSHTEPTAPPLFLTPRPQTSPGKDPSSSSLTPPSAGLKNSRVIPLETVYSGQDAVPGPGPGAGLGAVARGKQGEGEDVDGDGLLNTMLTPPPTPPSPVFSRLSSSSKRHDREPQPNPRHRRTKTASELPSHSQYPQHAPSCSSYLDVSTTLTPDPLPTRPKALSARVASSSDSGSGSDGSGSDPSSPVSCRSLPLPSPQAQRPQLVHSRTQTHVPTLRSPSTLSPPCVSSKTVPHAKFASATGAGATTVASDVASNPRGFNVRTASAQCKQLEGYVSFMAVEGLGDPGPESEVDGGMEESLGGGKKGKRWLLF